MIKFTDFLISCGVKLNLQSYKVHLATTGNATPPLEEFFAGHFKEWQEQQTRRNFQCDMAISLIEYKKDLWLFAGVYKILGHERISEKRVLYSTELLPCQDDLIGKVIVRHKRLGRASYLIGKEDGGEFYLSELKEKKLTIGEFPGYNSININYGKLKIVVDQIVQTWYGALSNIKGVYLITDIKTGKLYVGSATGDSGIWQRWAEYAANGHGGNKELVKLLKDEGAEYKSNFQYCILEIADSHSSDDYILQRESYWKNVLCSRDFGYNSN